MAFEDDMIEEGFRDEQDYLDYLMDEADAEYEKQQQDEEVTARLEDSFAGWSNDEIDYWEEKEREEIEQKRREHIEAKNQKIKEEKQLELWKEANLNEAKIWNISYSRNIEFRYFSSDNGYELNTEFGEWEKWIDERNIYRKWKQDHLKDWNTWKENRDKEDSLYEFLNWTEFRKIDDIWIDFNKWRDAHIEEWHIYKEKNLNVRRTDDVYELLAYKEYFYCYKHDRFELWKSEHEKEWEVWKKARINEWFHSFPWDNRKMNLSDYHYHYFVKWIESHSEVWDNYKKKRLDLWLNWENEFSEFWREITNTEPRELWLKCNIDDLIDFENNFENDELNIEPSDLWKYWMAENSSYCDDLDVDPVHIWRKCISETKIPQWITYLCDKKGALLWIKENHEEYYQWLDLYLWHEEHYMSNYREYNRWIDNMKSIGNTNIILFNFWKNKNSNMWKEWKRNNWKEWTDKVHDLDVWQAWVKDYFNEWKIWADDNLDSWKILMNENRDLNLYYAWQNYYSGNIDDFRLWKEKNLEDWEIWENELEDIIYKKKWEEEY